MSLATRRQRQKQILFEDDKQEKQRPEQEQRQKQVLFEDDKQEKQRPRARAKAEADPLRG
jgi:hypothetical protein